MKRTPLTRNTPLKRTELMRRADALQRASEPEPHDKLPKPRKRAPRPRKQDAGVEKCCLVCGAIFYSPPSQAQRRVTCSRRCAAAWKRERYAGTRKGAENPNFKGGARTGVRDRAGEERWYEGAATRCQNPGCDRSTPILNQHHVVYEQTVRREGGDRWDRRNGLTLCASCHMSHHRRGRVIALTALPDSAFDFAAELLGAPAAYEYLRRHYAGEDHRLEALIHPTPKGRP